MLADFLDGTSGVTGILEPMRERTHAFRQTKAVIAMVGKMMEVDRGLVHAGHESRSTGRTSRRCRKHPRVSHPLRRQFIEMRRMHPLPPETTEIQIAVVGDQPKDVWLILGKGNRGKEEYRKQ